MITELVVITAFIVFLSIIISATSKIQVVIFHRELGCRGRARAGDIDVFTGNNLDICPFVNEKGYSAV